MSESKADENGYVEVVVKIPLDVLLSDDPETVRKLLGENLYRRALLKMDAADAPLEASLG